MITLQHLLVILDLVLKRLLLKISSLSTSSLHKFLLTVKFSPTLALLYVPGGVRWLSLLNFFPSFPLSIISKIFDLFEGNYYANAFSCKHIFPIDFVVYDFIHIHNYFNINLSNFFLCYFSISQLFLNDNLCLSSKLFPFSLFLLSFLIIDFLLIYLP